jgi:GNAT superfamily N-acetyltransferase
VFLERITPNHIFVLIEVAIEDLADLVAPMLRRVPYTGTIVGPQASVQAMWDLVGDRWSRPREARWDQPHLEISSLPLVDSDPSVRVSVRDDFPLLYPACVAMYTEEVGISPESGGGADLYRARVQQLISRGWSFASFDAEGVVFKAEVACATAHAAQIQGVWVRPDRRGSGVATHAMATVVRHVRRHIAPTVSLYVNEWNDSARGAYAKVGFEQTATMSTLMF